VSERREAGIPPSSERGLSGPAAEPPRAGGATDPRIPMLDPGAAHDAGEAVGVPSIMTELNVFRVLLRHPKPAAAVHGLLSSMLWNGRLDVRLRELVIMRVGWRTGSVYEWTQHWRVARDLGVPEPDLLAVRDWRTNDSFGDVERAVLAATDETIDDGRISASTWRACAAHLDDQQLVELVLAIGNWRFISSVLESLEVPLEDGVDPWPPDGVAP